MRQTSVRPFVSDVYAVRRTDGRINIELPQPLLIVGDIKIEFIGKIKLLDIFNVSQRYHSTDLVWKIRARHGRKLI